MSTLKSILSEKSYLPILTLNDGAPVTRENWHIRRKEMLSLLEQYSYGKTPEKPLAIRGETTFSDANCCAGKVLNEKVTVSFDTANGSFSFPVEFFIPKSPEKPPLFLKLAFRPAPDRYLPIEEVTDAGYAIAVVVYTEIMNDNHHGDYSGGIAEHFGTTSNRKPDEWGKIGMWAYSASRVLDYIIAYRNDIDTSRVAVMGHSRLGKTALWCAAQDERFAAAISNDSGYGGAASSKHGSGERVTDFLRAGSWEWFCENFKQFSGDLEDEKP